MQDQAAVRSDLTRTLAAAQKQAADADSFAAASAAWEGGGRLLLQLHAADAQIAALLRKLTHDSDKGRGDVSDWSMGPAAP